MRTIHPDTRILEIAARQHGVVSREQLRQAGLSRGAIEHRLRKGTLRPVHRGVYRTGPTTPKYQAEAAALLACGNEAVLTHRTAAGILRIMPDLPREQPVDVSGPRSLRGPRSGVRLHRVGRLPSDEVCQRHGLAVAIAPRTILDLAAILGQPTSAPGERVYGVGLPTDFRDPSILIYEPQEDGSLRLVAVENLVWVEAWEEEHGEDAPPPTFHGVDYDLMYDDPATPDVDEAHHFEPHYDRHVWVHRRNPNGVFAQFNPKLSCRFHHGAMAH